MDSIPAPRSTAPSRTAPGNHARPDAVPLLSVRNVEKSFDGVKALRGVSFDLWPGECLALVGENGAGKSTLMKILSGVWPHGTYTGTLHLRGTELRHAKTLDARNAGVSIIHQELCLFPQLTVAENIFLSETYPYEGKASDGMLGWVRWGTMRREAQRLLSELGFGISADALVGDLSVAEQQLVEIARAFHQNAELLILDEPTSALSQAEVESLFGVLDRMKGKLGLIYISHKLEEVFRLCDRILVLRDGASVAELDVARTDAEEVIRHMVGRPLQLEAKTVRRPEGAPLMRVEKLSHRLPSGKVLLDGIGFDLHPGEVLGIAGLMGSGRSELLRSILGVLPGARTGTISYDGATVSWSDIREALDAGVAFVPEDRKKDGLFLDHSIRFNTTISILGSLLHRGRTLNLGREREVSEALFDRLRVKYADAEAPVRVLSGGNQQKVLLAKMVATRPRVLMLDEPTRGIDIGAKQEIYQIIRDLVGEGIAVIVVSSELPEVLALSDRVLVLREGKLQGTLVNENLTQEDVMAVAAGEA